MRKLFALFLLLALVGFSLTGCGGGGGSDAPPSQALQDLQNTNPTTNSGTTTPPPDPSVTSVKSVSITASSATVQAGSYVLLTATVLGSDGNGVADQTVTFSSTSGGSFNPATATTDSNGVARANFTPPTTVGATNAYATAGFVNSTESLKIETTAGPVNTVTAYAPTYTLPTGTEATVEALVADSFGNAVPGVTVRYILTTPNSGSTFPTKSIQSDLDGWTTTTYLTGPTTGTDTLTISANGKTATANISVSSTAVRVGTITLTPGASTLTANGTSSAKVSALVKSTGGSPASGVTVTFATSLGGLAPTTAITDRDGYAEATITAPTDAGTGELTAVANGIWSEKKFINFVAAVPNSVQVVANPSTVGLGRTTEIRTTVTDISGLPVVGETLLYTISTNASGASLGTTTGTTDNNGQASVIYTAGSNAGTDTITARTSNAKTNSSSIIVSATASTPSSLALTSANATLPADGIATTQVRATASNSKGPVQGLTISFATNAGTFPGGGKTALAVTDSQGVATVVLTSQTAQALATVSASVVGLYQDTQVKFLPGQAIAANSSLTATPASLPADGITEATVTAILADANGNLVSDGTQVTLLTSAGTMVSANPATTLSGRATFTLKAPISKAAGSLSVREVTGLSGSILFGSAATGGPANILVAPADSKISISGVGKKENTSITITIQDAYGSGLDETAYASNTVRVSFLTRPFGDEYLSGVNALGDTVSSKTTGSIDVRTKNGVALINLQAGQLPGVVEIRVEALDETGSPISPAVVAAVPQITIASGPPHTIVLTYPNKDSIQNMGGGVYRRIGKAIVTDRYGNSVPDGTAIYFGLVDSVIVEGTTGQTTVNSTSFADAAPKLSDNTAVNFNTASIIRNSVARAIQANDRLLVFNANAQDKSRHIATVGAATAAVQTNYLTTKTSLNYIVGASLLGGYISGEDWVVNPISFEPLIPRLVTGQGITKEGLATFYVTYPASMFAINTGFLPEIDTRTSPLGAARVYVVAAASDNSATTVNEGTFFFAPIAPLALKATPATISGTDTISLNLKDKNDVPVPFTPISSFVSVGTLGTFDACAITAITDQASCTAANRSWYSPRNLCINRNINEKDPCTAGGNSWITKLPSTFAVEVYIGNATLDGDMVPAYAPAVDTDLNGTNDFFRYPYIRVGGAANAKIMVRGGEFVQKDDAATITFAAGDAETTVSVKIP